MVDAIGDAWLVGGLRSPFGRFGGVLAEVPLVELGRQVVPAVLDRLAWPVDAIGEFDAGIGLVEGGLMVPARQIAFAAGLPEHLPSLTVDRACCSGLTAVGLGLRALERGAPSVLCLGIETMSRTPRLLHGSRSDRVGALDVEDLLTFDSPVTGTSIAEYVGKVALEHGVGREEQDAWALQSHRRYFAARERGFFEDEVVAIDAPARPVLLDEPPRPDTRSRHSPASPPSATAPRSPPATLPASTTAPAP